MLPKLFKANVETNENEEIIQWMMFLEDKSKVCLEMLSSKGTGLAIEEVEEMKKSLN